VKQESFWAWLQHTDNATHFKSNGLGAMAKLKVTLDIMHDKERTSKAKITSPILVAQHLRAIFCNKGCSMEHTDMKINQVVVMYLNDDKISRPAAPPVVSARKGIMSRFFFMFLAVPRHYARRSYSCWCKACSRVRGRGHESNSCGANLMVQGCARTKQTFWTEDQFLVTASSGIRDRDTRVAAIVARELEKAKPDKWGSVRPGRYVPRRRESPWERGCHGPGRYRVQVWYTTQLIVLGL
jgi:hypothetical protein